MKRDVTCCASGLQFQVKPFSNNVKGGGLLELNLHSKDSTVSLNCIVAGCLVYFLPANVETTIGSDKDCNAAEVATSWVEVGESFHGNPKAKLFSAGWASNPSCVTCSKMLES